MTLPLWYEHFAPEAEPIERLARFVLHQRQPRMRFDVVDPDDARRALSGHIAGHLLPETLAARVQTLADEVDRAKDYVTFFRDVLNLSVLELSDRPEAGP